MNVVTGRKATDGEIVILGVDDVELPDALAPQGGAVVLQANGADGWSAIGNQPEDWAAFGADLARTVPAGSVRFRTLPRAVDLRRFVRGWRLGGYTFTAPVPADEPAKTLVLPPTAPDVSDVLKQTAATMAARDLVNTPSNIKNPSWMVSQARAVARRTGAKIRVISGSALVRGGFGGVLAVGAGSATPPSVAVLRRPGAGPKVVLVGKGITYDTGGLSIKPRDAMALMKTDMAGAAAVLEALTLAPADRDVSVIVGFAENAVGSRSYRPGDVITHVDGSTSEVRNTDAEGRLVLADLLGYARQTLAPDVLVDVATLTGAATLALSREMGALYSTSARLASALVSAGDAVDERLWQMPLVEAYRPSLASDIADRCHIPTDDKVGAGSVTAALYLQSFVGDVPWGHLDIAGPARATATAGVKVVGGTGFGAALLGRWISEGARY